ncbi:hypothetical protein [Desulfofundulus salinus]|uniref:Thioredoxin domain-containing protein n=1 Tax=Desulfofundulus salinus TaxID=2419843 RepID=A0A494WYV6_9FIRM|nr:hypothetical protein [Desulfofundulus salinum]RKO65714.1 hypothetical protein D7024_01170 [Desulfofundulus salinum]
MRAINQPEERMVPLQKLISGSFFVAASIFLAIKGSPDVVTAGAVLGSALCAGFVSSKQHLKAVILGAALVAVSLVLQSIAGRCSTCIQADMLLAAGVVTSSMAAREYRLRVVSGVLVPALIAAVMFWGPVPGQGGPGQEMFGRYIAAAQDGKTIKLDTALKPVLLFSPECPACREALKQLINRDPAGKGWQPVLAQGDPVETERTLKGMGYTGEISRFRWRGPVPIMIWTKDGKTRSTHNVREMLEVVPVEP